MSPKPLTVREILESRTDEPREWRDKMIAIAERAGIADAKIVYGPDGGEILEIVEVEPLAGDREWRDKMKAEQIISRQSALLTFQASHIQSLTDLVGMLGALVEQYITATVVVQPGGEHADGT